EYKMTLATDLPLKAGKFRSIVDIMVSDRVLFSLLQQEFLLGKLSSNQMMAAAFESLRTLTKSGVQEASEEQGAGAVLKPDYILSDIHSLKTGILFQSPWALPDMLENLNTGDRKINDSDTTLSSAVLNGALFDIGMGCQIFDDMVDLSLDMKMDRHNYVASLIQYGKNEDETLLFEKIVKDRNTIEISEDFLFQFPAACRTAALKACDLLKRGAKNLFSLEHQFMVDVSILMISKRIGADRFLSDIEI
ncbi:MAG: hypothetical protein GY857_01950, partial [Desulfobacula sp.]|nr:hypothetical protein [Desulfobacula sp.]